MTDDRKERLEAALRAVVALKNPVLAASIRAALRGEDDFDPFQGMSIHPEIDELWSSE